MEMEVCISKSNEVKVKSSMVRLSKVETILVQPSSLSLSQQPRNRGLVCYILTVIVAFKGQWL